MSYRTVLVVTGVGEVDGDVRLAAGLAEEIGAHLSVFVVSLAAPPPIGAYAAVVSDAWLGERKAQEDALDDRVQALRTILASHDVKADVVPDYAEEGAADEWIGRRARYADITIVGPGLQGAEALRRPAINGLLFNSGRPMLVVPAGSKATLKPSRVQVAWNGTYEASRAVREALPVLVDASEVRLVLVDPVVDDLDHGEEPGADAATYLARHGVKVAVDRVPSGGSSVAKVLRRHAVDMGAEMAVMGAYGHSRLRQRIFGGVTHSMLGDAGIPVMMAR
jgi:nucleotide-binding universal stress UspA family protein